MYITNKEIIKCLFNDEKIHHITISTNDFGTFCDGFDNTGDRIKSISNINVTIDNDDFTITEYNDDCEIIGVCCIPLIWLLRNSNYPISTIC